MEKLEINEMMDAFLQNPSEEARQRLVSAVAVFVFLNLKCILAKTCPADEDVRSEFILWLYPQFERIIDRFDPKKASFSTYVSVSVKYRYIRFCSDRIMHEEIRRAAENEEIKFCEGFHAECDEALCACEISPLYKATQCAEDALVLPCVLERSRKSDAAKRRMERDVLLLTLKSTFYLSDEMIEKVAVFCDVPREELDRLLDTVRRDYSARQTAYEEMRLRRYHYYIRAFTCREKLLKLVSSNDSCDRERLRAVEKELDFCDKQEARINQRMKTLQRNPSNRYLARLLDMPRGSVNSSLARIKKEMYSLGDEDSSSDI